MAPSSPATLTIEDRKSATIAEDVSVSISSDGTDDSFKLDDAVAQELSIGVIYLAVFADGLQPRRHQRCDR